MARKVWTTGQQLNATDLNTNFKFGGDGSDGALAVSSGTTNIDLGGAQIVIKNYTSVAITGTGKVTFSNPHADGTIIIIRSQGDVTLTSSTIPNLDASGMGAAGGSGGAASASNGNPGNNVGTDGNLPIGYMGTDTNPIGKGAGQSTTVGAAATAFSNQFLYTLNSFQLLGKNIKIIPGAGGGGGAGSSVGFGAGSKGGDGGNGGGALVIECAGALNFTSTLGIDVSGKNGQNGADTTGQNSLNTSSAGGGGGGAAGMCIILYNDLTSASGTVNAKGGNGGAGGNGTHTPGGGGGNNTTPGSGGSGGACLNQNSGAGGSAGFTGSTSPTAGDNGGSGSGAGGGGGIMFQYNVSSGSGAGGGTGGSTNTSLWVIVKNYFFA